MFEIIYGRLFFLGRVSDRGVELVKCWGWCKNCVNKIGGGGIVCNFLRFWCLISCFLKFFVVVDVGKIFGMFFCFCCYVYFFGLIV